MMIMPKYSLNVLTNMEMTKNSISAFYLSIHGSILMLIPLSLVHSMMFGNLVKCMDLSAEQTLTIVINLFLIL